MVALYVTLGALAYGGTGVFAARKVFGWIRAKFISQYGVNWTGGYNGGDNKFAAFLGTLAAIPLWPLIGLIYIIVNNPPKTPKEVEAENERLRRQIERMEKDAGLGPQ